MGTEVTTNDIKHKVENDPAYSFLKTNHHLGSSIICLGLGGSYAYGTNVEGSDIDIRGVALNLRKEIILGRDFEQVVDVTTDTTIYSLRKIFQLLSNCNPNTIELLGLKDDQYIVKTAIWDEILRNKEIFISKRCINTFGGYAQAQLRRLETKSARAIGQGKREKYILSSIQNASKTFKEKYARLDTDSLLLHIEPSTRDGVESEIMANINVSNYPLRDLAKMFNDFNSIVRDYDKIGHRNKNAIEHNKLGKHMMHLIRLYYMAFDILELGEVNTYREKEHDLLMSIRHGDFLESDGITPKADFYKLIDELDSKFKKLAAESKLPDQPDMDAIDAMYIDIIAKYVL